MRVSNKAYHAKWREKNREKVIGSHHRYDANRRDRNSKKKTSAAYQKKQVETLSDFYVRQKLMASGVRNPSTEAIQEKRLQLKIIRKANELTRQINAY